MKPWDPPEEKLYPALDDLLSDWTSTFHPPYEGIRVLGTRWSNRSYELREFLARNQVPYQWIDVELAQADPEVRGLVDSLGPRGANAPAHSLSGWHAFAGAASAGGGRTSSVCVHTPRRISMTL